MTGSPELVSTTEEDEEEGYPLNEYQLTTTPNDFNILTIVSFIESKVFKIPSFQRHYVWDLKRASKLIESLLIGLPIPQIFLYESSRNEFLVIDGQQRLMTLYYFVKGRFPKMEKRVQVGEIFDKEGYISEEVMQDNDLFQNFKLKLDGIIEDHSNRFAGKSYDTLDDEYQTSLKLATIRNMIVKPVVNNEENEAMFEIFNRLNSGGMNLGMQEVRMSLYHSDFLSILLEMNKNPQWRIIWGKDEPNIHLNDVEAILRVFALIAYLHEYKSRIQGFLNKFSNHAKSFNQDKDKIEYYQALWTHFLQSCKGLTQAEIILTSNRFSIMLFESIFYASTKDAFDNNSLETITITAQFIENLKNDEQFKRFIQDKPTLKNNMLGRLNRAHDLLRGL
ncbi:DUF262 domain-containing protein [Candidatus Albibeggiatoa sp. nov. BB20]|uniref:DUF262 domain-containing protein n=1 Tax=Candidatus Albibeggiatoa sp. nov. BB20 TaxID=3162723 RepID=UPI003365690D